MFTIPVDEFLSWTLYCLPLWQSFLSPRSKEGHTRLEISSEKTIQFTLATRTPQAWTETYRKSLRAASLADPAALVEYRRKPVWAAKNSESLNCFLRKLSGAFYIPATLIDLAWTVQLRMVHYIWNTTSSSTKLRKEKKMFYRDLSVKILNNRAVYQCTVCVIGDERARRDLHLS